MERDQVAGGMSQPRQDVRKEMKAGKRRGTHWRSRQGSGNGKNPDTMAWGQPTKEKSE